MVDSNYAQRRLDSLHLREKNAALKASNGVLRADLHQRALSNNAMLHKYNNLKGLLGNQTEADAEVACGANLDKAIQWIEAANSRIQGLVLRVNEIDAQIDAADVELEQHIAFFENAELREQRVRLLHRLEQPEE